MSFDVTNPASWSTSTAPLGTLNVASPTLNTLPVPNPAAPTTGIVVDNNGTAGGQSEIYFLTQIIRRRPPACPEEPTEYAPSRHPKLRHNGAPKAV